MNLQPKRINWLIRNRKLWDGYNADLNWLEIEQVLLARMKAAKLFHPSVTLLDVSFDFLIMKAKTQMRGKVKV